MSSSDNISENTYRTVIGQTHESILAEYEEMNTGNAYTDNALYGMRKINGVNYPLTGGFCGELSSVKQENAYSAHSYSFYTVPRIEWERNDFLFTAATTVRWSHLPKQSYSRFCVSPFFCFRYKFTPRWKMSLLGSLDESEGGLKDIYPFRYREDYRTVVKHTGKVPVTVRQLYTCYLEYKNTIKEFFWTLSASYSHNPVSYTHLWVEGYPGVGESAEGGSNQFLYQHARNFDWGMTSAVGIENRRWTVKFQYEMSFGKESKNDNIGVNYNSLTLSVGYKLNVKQ